MRGRWIVEDAADAAGPAEVEAEAAEPKSTRRSRKRKDGQREAYAEAAAADEETDHVPKRGRQQYMDKLAKLKWRPVELNRDAIHFDMTGFGGLEELDEDDFDIETLRTEPREQDDDAAPANKRRKSPPAAADATKADQTADSKKKKKKKGKANKERTPTPPPAADGNDDADGAAPSAEKQATLATKRAERLAAQREQVAHVDVSAWASFGLHDDLLDGLRVLGFTQPTPVQMGTLHAALIKDRDVVGSAETGSGKTLAFGLSVLNRLLTDYADAPAGLKALILTPTRELAMQVRDHLAAVARFTRIDIVALVGGMSRQKQSRLLSRNPAVIVATPGRLWELISEEGLPYFASLPSLRFFVLDEADRMIENGHFKELDAIVEILNKGRKVVDWVSEEERQIFSKFEADLTEEDEAARAAKEAEAASFTRRTYVFSATITLGDMVKKQVSGRKKQASGSLSELMEKVKFRDEPEIVDVSRKEIVAAGLSESRIFCQNEEKDLYSYYMILDRPGKYIIFVNSIDCLRRLLPLLTLLQVPVFGLHAQMQQRQRLKNLDRFRAATGTAVLVASDVAARGLDIPDVDHVIHYQIPRSAETYVHRSGRTARANRSGTSLMLVGPAELDAYKQFCSALNKPNGIDPQPVDEVVVKQLARRVKVAAQLDRVLHRARRERADERWLRTNAEAAGIILDDDDDEIGGKKRKRGGDNDDDPGTAQHKAEVAKLRAQLNDLLRVPFERLRRSRP